MVKRTLQNCPKFSTRSLKEQNLAILEVANFAKRFIQTSLKEVVRSQQFIHAIKKFDRSYLDRIGKLIIKIIENPNIGKPMRFGRKGTREVYLGSFRLSYSYDKGLGILTLLDVYHKDEQ